ncbi:2-keto-4-pentenoate hydratase [Xylanimonas ulmi]|uniref:2-oxo-3-hexenedioate decarboxylase n=1 Tax=Xylanimonas ulmi TaxID=228973 RepID=A0A4Q7M3M3_9MICO|nr:fumarylacetoacetate hydrolase family protein [Xylanibacterium ulmi]RZS61467.1 2-oxo-3-hexenedioate decarboxylase [Xylanibacterium ulmi]
MSAWDIRTAACELLTCERERRDREPLSDEWPDLDLATAYAIQDATLRQRVAAGQCRVGVKLGLTSRAKQRRMGVDEPIVAWLTDDMAMAAGEPVSAERFIHPRVEPEIAFVMGADLEGPGVTAATAMDAVAWVYAGADVIDSRYRDFRFTLPDVVADNASSGAFVTGPTALRPAGLDLTTEAVLVEVDGEIVDTATGAAVLGHPAEALALAANALARRGQSIMAGQVVLTGGLTDAYPVPPGANIAFHFTHLGSLTVRGGA